MHRLDPWPEFSMRRRRLTISLRKRQVRASTSSSLLTKLSIAMSRASRACASPFAAEMTGSFFLPRPMQSAKPVALSAIA
jgi:hypothetical protein